MAEDKESKKYLELWKELDQNFLSWKSYFQEISDYILPRRGKYLDRGDSAEGGEKRHTKIIDGTATRSIRLGAAGIHGSLTSPARPWFKLIPPNLDMLKSSAVRKWLQVVENLIYTIYAKTNFYQCIHLIYEDEFGFGTGVLLQEEDNERVCRFYVLEAGEYRIAINHLGVVDTVARLFFMTAKQMEDKFGRDKLSKAVQSHLKKTPNKSFEILHIVQPNKERDDTKIDSANLPYKSVYLEYKNEQNILEKKGYHENPFSCPRWAVIGNECYGVSPGHDLLGDVKMLQIMSRNLLEASHKTLDPPVKAPSSMKDMLNTLPGGLNWVDATSEEALKPLYQINFDLQSTQSKIEDIRQQIREGFYNDLFLMISQSPGIQPKNQMEIMELQEEKLIMLGPVIERQFQELLDPVISRTFAIMWRNGLVPPPPPELDGIDIKVEYISFLAQAQKRIGTQAINSTIGFVGNLSAIFPDAVDKVNVDEAIDAYAELVGSPQQIIRDHDEVEEIRQAKAQQQKMLEMQQMISTMGEGAKAAKSLAGADTSGQNALTDLINGTSGTANA